MKAVDIRNKILDLGDRWVYRHPEYHYRELAQLMIGRPLRHYEHVHHIDGDHSNDSPDNLLVVNSRDHKRIHSGLAPRDFHWIGELSMHPCELMDQELDYQIRKSIDRELEPARISKMPKSKLTRSDLRIMKLID